MRVVHVCAYYAPAFVHGGPPRSIHGLCRALGRRGASVSVLTTDADGAGTLSGEITGRRHYEGVPVHYFPRDWPHEPIGSRALSRALPAMIAQADAVHIHGLWNRVTWAAAREARRAGVPYVLSPRGMLEPAALAHRAWRKRITYAAIERHTVGGAAVLNATSARERDTLRALRPAAEVVLVPNGIDLPRRPPADDGTADGPPQFVFVGRLHAIKRLDLLLDAFAMASRSHPEARLVIAGPDEQRLRPDLERRHPELQARVSWAGLVDAEHRDALLAGARALVLCSDSESFAMVVVEAMSAATPVIVTRTCGWEDLARHGAGLSVDQQPQAIANAMARLIREPGLAGEMGRRGRSLVERSYTWDAVADSFLRVYASLCPAPPPAVVEAIS